MLRRTIASTTSTALRLTPGASTTTTSTTSLCTTATLQQQRRGNFWMHYKAHQKDGTLKGPKWKGMMKGDQFTDTNILGVIACVAIAYYCYNF